jgi:hypothetical protein
MVPMWQCHFNYKSTWHLPHFPLLVLATLTIFLCLRWFRVMTLWFTLTISNLPSTPNINLVKQQLNGNYLMTREVCALK